jgi:putative SOS response-associated peptidase YedK
MCGRFTQQRPTSELAEIFGAEDLSPDPGEHYNVAPTDEAAVIVERDDRRAVTRFRWGLLPHWSKDRREAARAINARIETVADSPTFREAFRRRRCLVPVDSFYEWRRDGGRRQPFRIVRADGRPMALAGLWAGWRDPETGLVRRTFTIVTRDADGPIRDLHDRMPVSLGDEGWDAWLAPAASEPIELLEMLRAAAPPPVEIYPVQPLVNSVRNNGPALIEPIAV